MSTGRQLALRVIAESGLESEPVDNALSPEYVFNWLKARYQKILDAMPFGQINAAPTHQIVTNTPFDAGTVDVTYASKTVIGASFVPFPILGGILFRADGDSTWYAVHHATTGVITLDTVYVGETRTGVSYKVVAPYHAIQSIRWITSLVLPGYGELDELHFSKMLDLDPYRNLAPGQPRMWIKRLIDPTSRNRIIELYPYPDKGYRIDVYGYAGVDEPTLELQPHKEIDEEAIICGGLADAFGYRSQLAATQNQNEKAMTFMRLASTKKAEFDAYVRQISNRDAHDQEPPRIRVRMTHSQYLFHSPNENIIDAYDHVWRGNG